MRVAKLALVKLRKRRRARLRKRSTAAGAAAAAAAGQQAAGEPKPRRMTLKALKNRLFVAAGRSVDQATEAEAASAKPAPEPAREAAAVRRADRRWSKMARSKDGGKAIEPELAKRLALGIGLVCLLGVSFGVWAATTPIAGAVIASGTVIVESNVKKVQHQIGGIVSEILVKNGDRVAAGDIVLKLDETQARANLGIISSQLVQLTGRKARLEAERDQSDSIKFPPNFLASGEEAASIADGEKRLFDVRRAVKNGQSGQLNERIGQLRQEIKGLTAQRDAKNIEVELMTEELDRLDQMRKKELVPATRVLAAQRDLTRLKGEWGALVAQIARAQGQISEISLQIIGLDQNMQTEASRELREIEARIAELSERKVAAEDQLKRVVLRAPQDGIIHELAVHTIGGVIGAGETVMTVVPIQDTLGVEVRVATADIEQVVVGREASLRFPAFNQRTTPELKGYVTRIGADLTKELQTNAVFYLARIRIDDPAAEGLRLIPGMPVEAFIATEKRTALSYLVKPVSDQFARAFRER